MTKLLLVEDDNNLREIYEARLQAEGYTIVSAHDGEEALVVAKAEKPDLIISDVMMPKISGFEMLDILRNTDGLQDVKVIMLTALGQSDDQQRADRLGADRYLVKSQVTLEDIVKVAHELLGDSGAAAAPADATTTPTTDAAVTTAPAPPAVSADPAPAPGPVTAPPTPDPTPVPEPVTAPPADPVVSAPPAVDPAPIPEPALAEPPAATPAADATDTASTDAEPTANEEATVEAQIEDFVANTSVSAAPTAEAPAQVPTAVEVADEKLVSDAADTFEASTKAAGEVAAEEKDAAENQPQQKKVGGERVIEPIAGEPKKDLDALLAIEEAKEAQPQPAAAVIPVIVDNQKGSATPAATPTTTVNPPTDSTDKVDPSNIAL